MSDPTIIQPTAPATEPTWVRQVWHLLYRLGVILVTVMVAAGSLVMIVPFAWTALTSFKTWEEVFRLPITWLPDRITNIENYVILFFEYPTLRWLGNSIFVSFVSILSSVLFSSMAGYAFAKLRFRGKELFFLGVLALLMMPFELTFLPLFLIFNKLGLVNTYAGIIGPNLLSAVGVFIMRQFMQTIPDAYIDAARIDGASEIQIFRVIALPSASSAIVTLVVLKFIMSWNTFLWPLIMAQDQGMMTLTVGMQTFISQYLTDYRLLTASATVSVLPLIVLFVVGQRWVINAMIMSGLKG